MHPCRTMASRWTALGKEWAPKFRRVPCHHYLYGSLGDDEESGARAAKAAKKATPARRSKTARKGPATKVSRSICSRYAQRERSCNLYRPRGFNSAVETRDSIMCQFMSHDSKAQFQMTQNSNFNRLEYMTQSLKATRASLSLFMKTLRKSSFSKTGKK